MSNQVFDFCDTSRVIQELPPEDPVARSMNGWAFTSKPKVPYQREFKAKLFGLKWYLNGTQNGLDETIDPEYNAGRLLSFYRQHRLWDSFLIQHEYLGALRVRFSKPLVIPEGIPDSQGQIEDFEVGFIEHNPTFQVTPVNTALPTIIGTPSVGSELIASNGAWNNGPRGYAYQWKRNGVSILGANLSTYTLVEADLGANISITVTASNTGGSASATSAEVGPIVPNNPLALYALAFQPSDPEQYWVGGTRYGAAPYQLVPVTILNSSAGWTLDAGSTISGNALQIAGGSGLRASYNLENVPAGRTLTLAIEVSSMGSGDTSTYVALGNGVHGFPVIKYLSLGTNTATVTLANDFNPLQVRFTNDAPGATGPTISGISVLEAAGPYRLPGYTYTRTGEQGAVNFLYGANLVVNGDGSSTSGWSENGVSTTFSSVGGRLRVTADATAPHGIVQLVPVTVGRRYRLQGTMYASQGGHARLRGESAYGNTHIISGTGPTKVDIEFVAAATTLSFILEAASNSAWANNGEFAEFDDISVQEIIPGSGYGDELVTNGDASNGTTGWTTDFGTHTVEGGQHKATVSGGAGGFSQLIYGLTVGKTYRFRGKMTPSETDKARFQFSGAISTYLYYATSGQNVEYVFTAGTTTLQILAQAANAASFAANDQYALFDDISLVEVLPAVQYFPANVPAINDRGYHAFGALTNYVLRSSEFDNAAWTALGGAITANTTLAPDGTMTADTLTVGASASASPILYQAKSNNTTPNTISVFAKMGTCRYLGFGSNNAGQADVVFDLQAGTVAYDNGLGVGYIISIGGGWYRCIVTDPGGSYVCAKPGNTVDAAKASIASAFSGTETVHLWQAQSLDGNYPDGGPIIRTAGTTASIGASALAVADTVADVDQIFMARFIAPTAGSYTAVAKWKNASAFGPFAMLRIRDNGAPQVLAHDGAGYTYGGTGAALTPGGEYTMVAVRNGGTWRGGIVEGASLTWFSAADAYALGAGMDTLYVADDAGSILNETVEGVFRKLGTFDTDAKVLAAVVETA